MGEGVLVSAAVTSLPSWWSRLESWWFAPVARGRVAALRVAIYGFLFYDVIVITWFSHGRGAVPRALYQPLFLARHLNLPAPGARLIPIVMVALLACAAVAMTGRLPRVAGYAVLALYVQWIVMAFSYGKVDHDRFALVVALAVLPTVGRAQLGDETPDEASGWAVRCIQVAVVVTYMGAAWAKFRFGGPEWLVGATLMRAVLRRGTTLAEPLEQLPLLLQATQVGIVAFELAAPLLLAPGRLGRFYLGVALAFHLVTFAFLRLIFLPHVVCLLAFLPLERIRLPAWNPRPLRAGLRNL